MKKEIGIWLDADKAVLISLIDGKNEKVITLESEITSRTRLHGEKKPFTRLGNLPSETSSRVTNRRNRQMQVYFNKIIGSISSGVKELYLFGPSITKIKLQKELKKNATLSRKPIIIEPADKLTRNQMIARVKSHFE